MSVLPATYESILKIKTEHQCAKLHWPASKRLLKSRKVLVDATTACAVVAVHEAVSPENKIKLENLIRLGPDKVAEIAALAWRK